MQLKYVGPKPMISEHGISFKDGKEDKYVYIQNAIEILHALNHEYVKGKIYHFLLKILNGHLRQKKLQKEDAKKGNNFF